MFAAATYTASDPDVYAASIRAVKVDVVAVSAGDFQASVTRIDLGRLWMQRGQENLSRLFRSTSAEDRFIVSYLRPTSAPATRLGIDFEPGKDIAVCSPGQTVSWRSFGSCQWEAISLTIEDFARFSHTLIGRDLTPPQFQRVLTLAPARMSRLHRLREATFHFSETAPEVIIHPEVIRRLEQGLIQALMACFADRPESESRPSWRRAQLLAKFEAVLEENPGRALYLPEICEAIGVPGRTLRLCCAESLGMSPKRYFNLRRMHLARQALLVAAPEADNVTEIATRFGFFELGRFAVAYRVLFGEPPSTTLHRNSDFRPISSHPAKVA